MDNHSYQKPKKVRIVVDQCRPHPESGKTCRCHKVGDTFEFDFERCPQNFCAAAFHSLGPALRGLELGGRHPWDAKEGTTLVACPDPVVTVNFRIEAIEEGESFEEK